jgi:hypothetical protein
MADNGPVAKGLVESQRYRLHGRRAEAGPRVNDSDGFVAIVVSTLGMKIVYDKSLETGMAHKGKWKNAVCS